MKTLYARARRALSALALVTLASCARRDTFVMPVAMTGVISQNALAEIERRGEPARQVEIVDRAFAEALDGYGREVEGALVAPPDTERALGLLWLLAGVIETVPLGEAAKGAGAAERMRVSVDKATRALSGEADPTWNREIMSALDTATEALGALAEGPYRASTEVQEQMKSLKEGLGALAGDQASIRPREITLMARRAELVLMAMRNALGSGVVGP